MRSNSCLSLPIGLKDIVVSHGGRLEDRAPTRMRCAKPQPPAAPVFEEWVLDGCQHTLHGEEGL